MVRIPISLRPTWPPGQQPQPGSASCSQVLGEKEPARTPPAVLRLTAWGSRCPAQKRSFPRPLLSLPTGNLTSQSGGDREPLGSSPVCFQCFGQTPSPAELGCAAQPEARVVHLGGMTQEAPDENIGSAPLPGSLFSLSEALAHQSGLHSPTPQVWMQVHPPPPLSLHIESCVHPPRQLMVLSTLSTPLMV